MEDTPSAIAFRMTTSFKHNATALKKMVKTEGQRFVRKYKGKDVGICCYGLRHSDGVTWEYVNESKGYVLEETVTFNLKNAWIEGFNYDTMKIVLKPGQSKLVDVIFGAGSNDDAGNMESSQYLITKL